MWRPWESTSSVLRHKNNKDAEEELHRKRVGQILRYISTMQTTGGNGAASQFTFVRSLPPHTRLNSIRPFGQGAFTDGSGDEVIDETALEGTGRVLFTLFDFQRLAALLAEVNQAQNNTAASLPFHFYTPKSSNMNSRKRSLRGGHTSSTAASSTCWLRLTRLSGATEVTPPKKGPLTRTYLESWQHNRQGTRNNAESFPSLDDLTQGQIPVTDSSKVQRWIRNQVRYLKQQKLRRQLEPLYNQLFEWYHQSNSGMDATMDLIWGLGQAQLLVAEVDGSHSWVDGPLLEVRVEVELARDGALLVRPKEHTGVALHRGVIAAILGASSNASAGNESSTTRAFRQTVEAMDAADVAPGQPSTYTTLLKRMAVELSSSGTFQSSRSTNPNKLHDLLRQGKLVVTDAWCLYSSPRPSAVWARDALAFCENLSKAGSSSSNSPRAASANSLPVTSLTLPRALWALTHGPGALEETRAVVSQKISSESALSNAFGIFTKSFIKPPAPPTSDQDGTSLMSRPPFPLPTSDAQNRIADLLLTHQYPAVVCEGPPGTGKTHTIANVVCAYLCQGKRVLVTSKGAPALSVLRQRLPACVQELCVDVSLSESTGMRQLQQTVERLANKVAWVNTERELNKSNALKQNIEELEHELRIIDDRLAANAEEKRAIVQTQEGQDLFELALELIESAPWLMKTIAHWDAQQVQSLHTELKALVVPPGDDMSMVTNYDFPPSDPLISLAASNAGLAFSFLKNATKEVLASFPILGCRMADHCASIKEELERIQINGVSPSRKEDWYLVFQTLEREKAIYSLCRDTLEPLFTREEWPREVFLDETSDKKRIRTDVVAILEKASKRMNLADELGFSSKIDATLEMEKLDKRRTGLAVHIQTLAEDLVAARVVAELSKNFSAEAQSALVKFAQVSGKAKFGKSSQPSKMTQRQRRKRQEYLEAFEKCVRYIPCWILTTSQISDYLPSECLFDLVVIDEASQSDVTVLPGMLRGKQWLIVGDGKQVSPTESFVAEEQIEMLKAALPDSPFEASMLPGHSFFDLCAQAFPKGRVILREHFRCAPEIISFSNAEFYNGNLVPLRLPTSTERLKPSLIDIRVRNGRKTGKINEQECDEIVKRIKTYVESCTLLIKRSIGVISLVGDEQSRLIRGRLLDQIGPHKYKLHNILVGEPPSFQGAERDIVFLSMVCSPGSVVTQSQLMHAQRVNVALSRARDRMVLVRSIDTNHIPNEQDIKFSVLDFFERAKHVEDLTGNASTGDDSPLPGVRSGLSPYRTRAKSLLIRLLQDRGFTTQSMGVVWDNAICIEDAGTSARAAICVEATGESLDDWKSLLEQQKSIERVGWKCLRVDAVSLLADYARVLSSIEHFLATVHVNPRAKEVPENEGAVAELLEAAMPLVDHGNEGAPGEVVDADVNVLFNEDPVMVISSDEENDDSDVKAAAAAPVLIKKEEQEDDSEALGNGEKAADYGNVADIGFLQGLTTLNIGDDAEEDDLSLGVARLPVVKRRRRAPPHQGELDISVADVASPMPPGRKRRAPTKAENVDEESGDLKEKELAVSESTKHTFSNDDLSMSGSSSGDDKGSTAPSQATSKASKRRRRQRLDRYSRDPRYHLNKSEYQDDITHDEFNDEVLAELPQADRINIDQEDSYEGEFRHLPGCEDDESYQCNKEDVLEDI